MSGVGKWNLGVGLALLLVAVLCRALELIPATVITGILSLVALGVAGYDAIYEWASRPGRR
jgi:hypothetical protein